MKRFFSKIARFFWSWGFLKFILVCVTLVIFLYVEEDWRGARAWAAIKAKWEARGESFDLNKFTPPPVPDDENLAAIPIFKMEPYPGDKDKADLYLVTLQNAMSNGLSSGTDFPPRGNWQLGELPDMDKIRFGIAAIYATAFKGAPPPKDALAQFDALYPFLSDLRVAAATRPSFRLPVDYTISPPASRALGVFTDQMKLSKILTLHAVLALDHHQSDLALEDMKVNFNIARGVKRDSSLVCDLVAMGMTAIANGAIYTGLTQHEWSDANLVEIDHILKPINFLADYQFAMRSTAAESIANIEYFKHAPQSYIYGLFQGPQKGAFDTDAWMIRFAPPWAGGWWDQNKRQMADILLHELATVDPQSRLTFPKVALDMAHQVNQAAARWDANAPWNIWYTLAAAPSSNCTHQFASAQVWVDEERIVCALERYRLAHGVYPDSLDALAPAYIDELPHDIMNGEPYHYQLRPDGTFLLYSVGWNQTDDGGKAFYQDHNDNHQKVVDYARGDWVWPTPQPSLP